MLHVDLNFKQVFLSWHGVGSEAVGHTYPIIFLKGKYGSLSLFRVAPPTRKLLSDHADPVRLDPASTLLKKRTTQHPSA